MTAPAHVTVRQRSLWRLRAGPAVTRNLVRAAAVVGLIASARYAIEPPRPRSPPPVTAPAIDQPAEGYAALFTRRYLTWDASSPEVHRRGLAGFAGDGMDPDVGMHPPGSGRQSVLWAQVVQSRPAGSGERIYSVAAETDAGGLTYLSVPVRHPPGGPISLAGYPAFVGAPAASGGADTTASLPDVGDGELSAVVARALGNYLAGASSELASDLSSGASVSPPAVPLSLQRIDQLKWSRGGGSVVAQLDAAGGDGAQYTLDYEVDVARVGGRWEVSAIQMDPNQ